MSRTLSIRVDTGPPRGDGAAADPASVAAVTRTEGILRQALATATSITATYNNGAVLLQPYAMFREHDALFLEAVTVSRDGKPPKELKVGTYRLSGLKDVGRTSTGFTPRAEWRPPEDRPGKQIVAKVA